MAKRTSSLLLLAAGLVAACGGGGGSSSLPTVEFVEPSSSFSETSNVVQVVVALSSASSTAVEVPFVVTGTATEEIDYTLVTPSPLVIPAGSVEFAVVVRLLDDDVATGSLGLELSITSPVVGANAGDILLHSLSILDDENPVTEVEDNDNLKQAMQLGSVATLGSGAELSIAGEVASEADDLFDVFRITIPENQQLLVSATFVGAHPDLLLTLTDRFGVPFAEELDPDSVSFLISSGASPEPIYLVVQSTGAARSYEVRLEATSTP